MSMYPWESWNFRARADTELKQSSFTPEELARLEALRNRVQSCSVDIEVGLDECRLKFARWLVEHGKLSEDLPLVRGEQ